MTVLQALNDYYGRMSARGEAESHGYSREKISFAVVLSADGTPVDKLDLRDFSSKKPQPRLLEVPAATKRTVGIQPNIFWDKTAYVLGRTAGSGRRITLEHEAFKSANLALLAKSNDLGLVALRRFLESWLPDRFDAPPFVPDMLDTNIVFQLDGDGCWLHERQAARAMLARSAVTSAKTDICLITGVEAPVRRLHPTIKGVEGAQSSGAALVSFNLDAFTSYGKEQGDNAPTSEAAAFRYGAALNRMLDRASRNRLPRPVGDATVIFWADASGVGEGVAEAVEDAWAAWVNPQADDTEKLKDDEGEAAKLWSALKEVAAGRPLADLDPRLRDGVRFHILGLAPNAARLAVRFWLEDRFEVFARRLADHYSDLEIEPRPWRATPPSVPRLLVKTTALQEKFENIPPLLAGEVMRAILTGGLYPRTLLTAAIMRLRAGDNPASGWHAAVIRAVLARVQRKKRTDPNTPEKGETPVSLDREHSNKGYQLGRLFAVYELAQKGALPGIKSTIRDKYFGSASSAPASTFPLIIANGQNHLSKLRKEKPGWAHLIEKELEEVMGRITPVLPFSLPRSMRLEDQGEFAIGYYHQRTAKLGNGVIPLPALNDINEEEDESDD